MILNPDRWTQSPRVGHCMSHKIPLLLSSVGVPPCTRLVCEPLAWNPTTTTRRILLF